MFDAPSGPSPLSSVKASFHTLGLKLSTASWHTQDLVWLLTIDAHQSLNLLSRRLTFAWRRDRVDIICCLNLFCTRERGVWLGLSDVSSPGKLRWVNGSEAQEGEEALRPRSAISPGNLCVSVDQHGQTSSHLCDAKRAYLCQYISQGTLSNPTKHACEL